MWYNAESTVRPNSIDETLSNDYVYLRKNIQEVIREDVTYYIYKEKIVKKTDWDEYKEFLSQEEEITELQLAITELYKLIGGAN